MGRFLAVIVVALGGLVFVGAPAEAKADSVRTGCRDAAVAYKASGNTDSVSSIVAQLEKSSAKTMRRLAAALDLDPVDKTAVRRLGAYCKKHYPKDATIRRAAFVVPTTTTTVATTTTTPPTTTAPPPPPTAPPTEPQTAPPTEPQTAPPTEPPPQTQPPPQPPSNCNPNYDPCVPNDPTDVDCAGGSGNGPSYVTGPVRVIGTDVYGLDSNGDGVGCE